MHDLTLLVDAVPLSWILSNVYCITSRRVQHTVVVIAVQTTGRRFTKSDDTSKLNAIISRHAVIATFP